MTELDPNNPLTSYLMQSNKVKTNIASDPTHGLYVKVTDA